MIKSIINLTAVVCLLLMPVGMVVCLIGEVAKKPRSRSSQGKTEVKPTNQRQAGWINAIQWGDKIYVISE